MSDPFNPIRDDVPNGRDLLGEVDALLGEIGTGAEPSQQVQEMVEKSAANMTKKARVFARVFDTDEGYEVLRVLYKDYCLTPVFGKSVAAPADVLLHVTIARQAQMELVQRLIDVVRQGLDAMKADEVEDE